jgi:hypothetical protein
VIAGSPLRLGILGIPFVVSVLFFGPGGQLMVPFDLAEDGGAIRRVDLHACLPRRSLKSAPLSTGILIMTSLPAHFRLSSLALLSPVLCYSACNFGSDSLLMQFGGCVAL